MGKWLNIAMAQRAAMDAAGAMLTDEQAILVPTLYTEWEADADYAVGDRKTFEGVLYKCLISHRSQADWSPAVSPSLWTKVLIPDPETIPEWEQPDSTNGYMKGDKVTHNGKTWESTIDNNVWEPGMYGWTEVV